MLSELLQRFRQTATPGAPAAAGSVPADTEASLEAELRPLFAALDELEEESRAIVARAEAEASGIREHGTREAERILARAQRQAAALRTKPLEEPPDEDAEERAILARAQTEADDIRRLARQRIPGMVERVMTCLIESAGPAPSSMKEEASATGVGRG